MREFLQFATSSPLPDPPCRRNGEPGLRSDRRGRRGQRLGGLRRAGHDVHRDLCHGVRLQAERRAALGHHAADALLAHREHDLKGWKNPIECEMVNEQIQTNGINVPFGR